MSSTEEIAALAGDALTVLDAASEKISIVRQRLAAIQGLAGQPNPDPDPDVALTVTPLDGQVRMDWTTDRTDITGWTVARDGVDTHGSGPWSTHLPAEARSHTMRSLHPGRTYMFGLQPHPGGELETATATPTGASSPGPDPDPGPKPGTDTAAARFGWRNPFFVVDRFEGLDPAHWQLPGPDWDGHAGNGRRRRENVLVENGVMVLRGDANGDTGWIRATPALGRRDLTGGVRIEIRSRAFNTGSSGEEYHPLHLIWPTTGSDGKENRFRDGEIDWSESKKLSGHKVGYFLHFPGTRENHQVGGWEAIDGVDITGWHNYAVEWRQGAGGYIAGFIDGVQRYRHADGAIPGVRGRVQDMPEGRLTIQLDNFTGDGGLRQARFEVESVRMYPLGAP